MAQSSICGLASLIFAICLFGYTRQIEAYSAKQIHDQINDRNWRMFVNIGGRYGYLKIVVSRQNLIESDHFPPFSVYASARDPHISGIAKDDMAAVSMKHGDHRNFITTGTTQGNDLVKHLHALFNAGHYEQAIRENIKWYRDNPPRGNQGQGQGQGDFRYTINQGIIMALRVHVSNGLITEDQRNRIIADFKLDTTWPTFSNINNDVYRDDAIRLVNEDMNRYARARG